MTIVHYAKMRRAEICNATWSVWSRRLYDYIRPTQYSVYANIVWLRLIVSLKTLEDKSFRKNDFFGSDDQTNSVNALNYGDVLG